MRAAIAKISSEVVIWLAPQRITRASARAARMVSKIINLLVHAEVDVLLY
jgi:hypothetical protein